MKKFSLLILALLVGFVALADNPTSTPPTSPPINDIPLDPKPNIPKPLSLNVDIEANYYNGVLTVVLNTDLGYADIVVMNTTTGEVWYDSVNGVGAALINISGEEGCYLISICTDRGEYIGTFEL